MTMRYPRLTISLSKIEQNSSLVNRLCRSKNIEVTGVTKGALGSLEVAGAIRRGGVTGLADSHIGVLRKFKEAGIDVPLWSLRQPMRDELEEAALTVDNCLISEVEAAEGLSRAARKTGRKLKVLLFLEAGSLREGMNWEEIMSAGPKIEKMTHLELCGLAVYRSCRKEQGDDASMVARLIEAQEKLDKVLGRVLPVVSGGNSSGLQLVSSGKMPPAVNNLRLGEAILLGHETAGYRPLPGAATDAFILTAEVIEVKRKPDPDSARRIILALGREDLAVEPVLPLIKAREVNRSSSHLVLELPEDEKKIKVGETVSFLPNYFSLVAAMASPFVTKEYVD